MSNKQQGVALVLVLWVVTLLAVIAGNFAYSMRSEMQMARNFLSAAQAQAHADAGVHRASFELLKPPIDQNRWLAFGTPYNTEHQGVGVRVTLHDEFGKIDINSGSDALRLGLFKWAGLNDQASSELLNRIKSSGLLPLEAIDKLRLIDGVTNDLYARIAPFLTVYSGKSGISTAHAPKEVLLSIPGINPAMVEQYVEQRQMEIAAGLPVQAFSAAGPYSFSATGISVYLVQSVATMPDGAGFARRAVVRLTGNAKQPVQFLDWGDDSDRILASSTPVAPK
jgi:general secretion pathway protein K